MKETNITKENFKKYEQKVCQIEHRRKKKLIEWKYAEITSGIVFFAVALSAGYFLLDKLLIIPQIGFLGGLWGKLSGIFLSGNYSVLEYLLFSVSAAVVNFSIVHLLTVLVVELVYSGGSNTPLAGSDAEQAAALYLRCVEAGTSVPFRYRRICISVSAVYMGLLLIALMLEPGKLWDASEKISFFEALFDVAIIAGIFFLIFAIPYAFCLWLSSFLYRIRRKPGLENALLTYSNLCKKQEQEKARAEEKRKRIEEAERNRLRGDDIYRKAIAGGRIDEDLVWQAADLGCRPASLYLGRQMIAAWSTGPYTKEEKADIAEVAKDYFYTASFEEDFPESKIEAQFGYLMFRVITESGDSSKWRDILSQLRSIQSSGLLPEWYHEICAMLIGMVVDFVDTAAAQEASRAKAYGRYDEPVIKRCYCKFFNAGICGKRSTAYYVAHCEHVSDPGKCSTALLEHGLSFEFE